MRSNRQSNEPYSASRYASQRQKMVELLRSRGIRDARLLKAMAEIPRHWFVPEAFEAQAYGDHALPIGQEQTISQPYMAAQMTELLQVNQDSTVPEIGAGSGYQTAVLSAVARRVFALERLSDLARTAHADIPRA